MNKLIALLLAALLIPACGSSSDSGSPPPPAPLMPVATAGEDFKALSSGTGEYYTNDFATAAGWTLTGLWAVDGSSAVAPGGAFRSAPSSLNYNNGIDFNSPPATLNKGTATSPVIDLSALGSPALVFWCNYDTETVDASKDKRSVQVSTDFTASPVVYLLNQQLAGTAVAPYQCAGMGTWHRHVIPLSRTWGMVQIRFGFDSVDGLNNGGNGWFIDDLAIMIRLSAKGSWDPAGGAVSYLWQQTGGVNTVTLSDPTSGETLFLPPSFIPPAAADLLEFTLSVTGANGTASTTVNVDVRDMMVTVPDTWFVGYGKPWTLTATVHGGSANFDYQWSGTEAWVGVPSSALTTLNSASATNSLSNTSPVLTDFQKFPDLATVGVLERTTQGRLQLRVQVTDGSSTPLQDESFVNFAVGPFADPVANENVALGEPIFFNGAATNSPSTTPPTGAITSWTWDVIVVPGGSAVTAASLKKQDKSDLAGATTERFVYFVPDKVGQYTLSVSQASAATTTLKVIDITCGTYIGIGGLTGTPPDPNKGECAACHGGQTSFLAPFAVSWKQTAHSKVMQELLDPAETFYAAVQAKGSWLNAFNFGSDFSIDSRNVGWSRPGPNPHNGWAERAANEGFVLKGATWPELVRKHPKTAGLSNVQCESCHGPGSEHAGDTTGIRKSYDANVCGRCHSDKYNLWEASAHGLPPIASPANRDTCNGCHTAQGYIVEMRAQENADPHPVLFSIANLSRPVLPAADQRGTTCQTCHEPHKLTVGRPAGGDDPQLRCYGNVKFRNDAVVNAGAAGNCFMCHQSRRDPRPGSLDANTRSNSHDSTAAEMLTAKNGAEFPGWVYNSSPHGIPSRFVVTPGGENRQCLACHHDVVPGPGGVGYGALGGHSFAMTQGDGLPISDYLIYNATTAAADKTFLITTPVLPTTPPPQFLRKVVPGDLIVLNGTPNTVLSVDNARQLTLVDPPPGVLTSWSLTSVKKYNAAACTQCHPMALDFKNLARGDYDGSGVLKSVQDEIAGLLAKVEARINLKLPELQAGATLVLPFSSKVQYLLAGKKYTFPGPNVPASESPISWFSLTPDQQADWNDLYQAAYNCAFVIHDGSNGLHNTGYAVNLLQSSFKNIHLSTDPLSGPPSPGAPYVPY